MAKRETLGLPRVPTEWDFLLHQREEDGGLPAARRGMSKVAEDDDVEWLLGIKGLPQEEEGGGRRTVMGEFAIPD